MAADNGPKVPIPFDVRTIKELVVLMSRHDLSEIDLREGEIRIRLRRGSFPSGGGAAPSPAPLVVPATPTITAPAPAKSSKPLVEIKAQTPGTFYAAPSPGAKPFVELGSRVTPTTTVCVIEAMKVMNEIPADCSGVIAEVCVSNGEPVEYEQVLFRVDPAG